MPTEPPGLAPAIDFATFMRRYQNMVFSTAARLTGDDAQAEDIAQEVFLKAHEHFDTLRESPTAGGWLKTVTRNLSLNHLQRYRHRWSFFSEFTVGGKDGDSDRTEVEFASPDTFFQGMEASDRAEMVEKALAALPDRQRIPLVLYHFEELSYEEIAAKLRISLPKVKIDIMRGRAALAQQLSRGTAADQLALS
ncbi:MAG TPA: sigma-70 family RNA polymerase sigma factor [Opitutaceae bacterium]